MAVSSKIEWTDTTWNPVRGCTKISPGCTHCYAETFAERSRGVPGHPYEQGFDLRFIPEKLLEPLRWRSARMVFVNWMSDLFHEDVPDDYICRVAEVIGADLQRIPGFFTQTCPGCRNAHHNEGVTRVVVYRVVTVIASFTLNFLGCIRIGPE
jgi:protein gp37